MGSYRTRNFSIFEKGSGKPRFAFFLTDRTMSIGM